MDPILWTSVIAAAIPVVTDFLKTVGGGIARRVGGLSVDDQIKLEQSMVERLKALAGLDQPGGTPSQWVVDLRASFRYIAAAALIVIGGAAIIIGLLNNSQEIVSIGGQLASFPFGFIFGERLVLALRPPGMPANAPATPSRVPVTGP
ncbi:MAG: hypothetical protein KBG29_11155 [Pseudomonadales bacterium]|nr:hypothetical protein [Pseudomonadales bacterium]